MTADHGVWRLFVDTGGTFTDCLGIDPAGGWHRAKVLSSSALRATALPATPADRDAWRLRYDAPWRTPPGFAIGAEVRVRTCGWSAAVTASADGELTVDGDLPALEGGETLELRFAEEAPVLAARLMLGVTRIADLPPIALRLATTRGTNALLERRGARVALLITRGFGDLLRIGDQQRPDLFALAIEKSEPLYERVLEIDERLAADGQVVRALDLTALEARAGELDGIEAVAVAFLHSYLEPRHEDAACTWLRERGHPFVSSSARLSPAIEILARAQTAVVDAYLAPILHRYLEQVAVLAGSAGSSLHVMTSAGGLARADVFRAKDSLLSGPAGGVVGAAAAGRAAGCPEVIGFDMGGTSTDVCRYAGDFEYRYEQRVGDARLLSPALAIETVAAGGGSICWLDEQGQWKVGPRSAGATPGPACYGAGGPLTLTDVNLLLGRLLPGRFAIPLDVAAARRRLDELLAAMPPGVDADVALLGFLEIANERMAEAIRRISVRQGYDPAGYALIAFGGAGGQHACAVAELLGMSQIVLPADAGLLSARGLMAARHERQAQRPVLARLADVEATWPGWLEALAKEAGAELEAEGVTPADIEVRRRVAVLRLVGQENALEIEVADPSATGASRLLEEAFRVRYEAIFGYAPPARPLELVALRLVAASRSEASDLGPPPTFDGPPAPPFDHQRAYLGGAWRDVPLHDLHALAPGATVEGPALVLDHHASLALESGWRAEKSASGSLVARRLD